ncbi:MAG: competence/damage-inducible protein A, partial [Candidatus Coatesbacteria bacterium 4484_99]
KLYGYGEDGLEIVVGKLLRQNGMTISTAESCTGGLVSNRIVSVPGASDYFLGGVVAYSNEAKSNLLGVSEKTLSTFGAVSPETAEEMALGVRKKFASNIAVSTTGIAGPTGGTAEKPVGLVYVGWSYDNELGSKKLMLGEMTRDRVRLYTSQMALDVTRRILSGMSLE